MQQGDLPFQVGKPGAQMRFFRQGHGQRASGRDDCNGAIHIGGSGWLRRSERLGQLEDAAMHSGQVLHLQERQALATPIGRMSMQRHVGVLEPLAQRLGSTASSSQQSVKGNAVMMIAPFKQHTQGRSRREIPGIFPRINAFRRGQGWKGSQDARRAILSSRRRLVW